MRWIGWQLALVVIWLAAGSALLKGGQKEEGLRRKHAAAVAAERKAQYDLAVVLRTLREEEYERLRKAYGKAAASKADVDRARVEAEVAKAEAAAAEARLDRHRGVAPGVADLRLAKAEHDLAVARTKLADQEYDRVQRLHKAGRASRSEAERARARLAVSKAKVEAAKARLAARRGAPAAAANVRVAQAQYDEAVAQLGLEQVQYEQARRAREAGRAARFEADRARWTVTAAKAEVTAAKARLDACRGGEPVSGKLRAAKAAYDHAAACLKQRELDYEKFRIAWRQGAVTKLEMDQARGALGVARATALLAKVTVDRLGGLDPVAADLREATARYELAAARLESAEAEYIRMREFMKRVDMHTGLAQAELDAARARVTVCRAAFEVAHYELLATIRAVLDRVPADRGKRTDAHASWLAEALRAADTVLKRKPTDPTIQALKRKIQSHARSAARTLPAAK